jgi:hypothetical protein
MLAGTDLPDLGERKLRDWILSLLRFAITQMPEDQAEALALASELDTRGKPGNSTFFQRTSVAVCHAIVVRDENGRRVLGQYISRIEEPRLRSAFAAAIGPDAISLPHHRKKARRSLRVPMQWRGLP